MEGRGVASVTSAPTSSAGPAQAQKRRRQQTTGTKRKAIHSIVASAQRQGKRLAAENPDAPTLPSVAPTLAYFVMPTITENGNGNAAKATSGMVTSTTTSQGTISGPALEESM